MYSQLCVINSTTTDSVICISKMLEKTVCVLNTTTFPFSASSQM